MESFAERNMGKTPALDAGGNNRRIRGLLHPVNDLQHVVVQHEITSVLGQRRAEILRVKWRESLIRDPMNRELLAEKRFKKLLGCGHRRLKKRIRFGFYLRLATR